MRDCPSESFSRARVFVHALAAVVRFSVVAVGLAACAGDGGGGSGAAAAECEVDLDCRAGRHCVSGVCEAAAITCQSGDQCPPSLICSNAGCRLQACEGAEQCPPGYVCGPDARCRREGSCFEDADCPTGLCDTYTNTCEGGGLPSGCGDASVCPAGEICVDERCVPDGEPEGCQTDTECRPGTYCAPDGSCLSGCRLVAGACGANRVCDPETRTCREGCAADSQCPTSSYCGPEGECVRGCRLSVGDTGENCGADRACDPATRACVCTADAACTASEYCNGGTCFAGCRLEPDTCQNGRICDPASRMCLASGCEVDDACDPGQYCGGDGMCATGCRVAPDDCGAGNACDPVSHACVSTGACALDADCPAESYCTDQGVCAAGCRLGGCPAGQVCELASRVCGCGDDTACPEAEWCNAGICRSGCRFNPENCPENQFCDRARRACGCLNDDGCVQGEYCANGVCRAGCRIGGEDCPDGECDPLNHRCTCQSDGGCAAGEYCNDGACLPGCRVEPDDCAPAGVCDPATRECRCQADAACPEGQYCTPDNQCALGCRLEGEDCGAGSVCDPETRRCSCADDGACAPGQRCAGGACVEGCRLDPDDCGDGQRCDPATRACVCAGDAACAPSDYCAVDGACRPGCRTEPDSCDVGSCDPALRRCGCASDADCVMGEYCGADGTCTLGCRLNPDDCGNGVCDPVQRRCVPEGCVRDADCAPNQACGILLVGDSLQLRCLPALARGREGAACVNNVECAARSCVGGEFCFFGCGGNDECQSGLCIPVTYSSNDLPGQTFDFNTCAPLPQLCDANAQCDQGEICVYQGEAPGAPNTPLVACATPEPGAAIGAACNQEADCASRICLNQGVCWGPCRPALGAQDCPAAQRCYTNSVYLIFDQGTPQESDDRFAGLSGCLPERGSDTPCPRGVCPGNEVCLPQNNGDFTGFDLVCRSPVGNGQGGAACGQDADCRSGTCLAGLGVCLGVCDPADPRTCAGGTNCRSLTFTVWDRGTPDNELDDVTAPINICVPF